jgi:hypothetical protein
MGHREIDEKHPAADKDQNGAVFHPFSNGANDECRSDDCKHQLIHGIDVLGNPV